MRFTKTHEWLGDGDPCRLGISAFAQEAMGDIVYFEFLVSPGDEVSAGEPLCDIESVKTSAQAYAPHDCTVAEINAGLADDPSPIGAAPEGEGWLVAISPGGDGGLMDEAQYRAFCEEGG
ncbi:glycine cleavage system protein H [bacterium]|nr:glycine cleavage system protein H [bacterium]